MNYTILKVQWKKAMMYGSPSNLISGHRGYRGSIQLLLDKRPKLDDFTFVVYGNIFFAETGGFVRVFKHIPGSTDGFAGSEYTLNFDDGPKTFKGSLWDPKSHKDVSHVPEYRSVSITDEKDVMERGHTFFAGYVTKALYDNLIVHALNKLYDRNEMLKEGLKRALRIADYLRGENSKLKTQM